MARWGVVPRSAESERRMPAEYDNRTGTWRYRKWVQLPEGTRTRIRGTPAVNTKKAAEHAERIAIEKLMNPGSFRPAEPAREEVPTLKEYSKGPFLEGYAAEHKPSERAGKLRILRRYIWPVLGHLPVDQIGQEYVDRVRADLLLELTRSGKPRERRTVNNIMSVLSALLRYAATNGRRGSVSEMRFIIKEDESELVALHPEQVDALVAATSDLRYRAAILLGADAGLRIGEIRGLEWDCLNELRRRVIVSRAIDPANNEGSAKNRKRRSVPMTPRLWDAVAALPRRGRSVIGRRSDGRALGYYTMREALLKSYDKAKVPPPPKPWHCLRHTFCTELAKAGVSIHVIKRLAGHESIETTLKYMHATERDLDQAVEALAGTFGTQAGHKTTRATE